MDISQIKTQKFIVKFFPEIMIKGASAKRQMIAQLNGNLQKLLGRISQEITLKKFFDKIEVVCPIEVVTEVRIKLLETPGVELVLEALQFDNITTLDQIKVIVNDVMAKEIQNKSFVVRAKRS
ncbi:MAG: tRNA 4-thiouridine(8) synthase ThiI, partial [Deltaproteobacteria bacterium HGW-Deltaproteobacteria-24]